MFDEIPASVSTAEREIATLARRLDHLLRVEQMPTNDRSPRWRARGSDPALPAITRTATWRRLVELGANALPALDRALLAIGAPGPRVGGSGGAMREYPETRLQLRGSI